MVEEKIDPMVIDKSPWGDGPWQTEPDRVEWEHAGFPCLALRHDRSGHFCGYVAVPPGHPLHGKPYDDASVEVHGGLTYASACDGSRICHIPKPGEPADVWWFGFDCAHGGDYSPRSNKEWGNGYPWPDHKYDHATAIVREQADGWAAGEVYRDLTYVQTETNRLAEQLLTLRG